MRRIISFMSKKMSKTLLIVDDDQDMLNLLSEQLKKCADKILTAPNGAVALELIEKNSVDAILTDINMPVMTGLQLLYEIRLKGMKTPVVVLTGYAAKENIALALRLGAKDFLEKPVKREVLFKVVNQILDLGVLIRKTEAEIERMCSKLEMTSEKLAYYKEMKLNILLLRRAQSIFRKGDRT